MGIPVIDPSISIWSAAWSASTSSSALETFAVVMTISFVTARAA
jgi:hypothetical protein